jgi:uncharacterized protein (DUF2164 family)
MGDCPECHTELENAAGIGPYCSNKDCPVSDDATLWDGEGNREESPIKLIFNGKGEFSLTLDEFKRLQKQVQAQQAEIEAHERNDVAATEIIQSLTTQLEQAKDAYNQGLKDAAEIAESKGKITKRGYVWPDDLPLRIAQAIREKINDNSDC